MTRRVINLIHKQYRFKNKTLSFQQESDSDSENKDCFNVQPISIVQSPNKQLIQIQRRFTVQEQQNNLTKKLNNKQNLSFVTNNKLIKNKNKSMLSLKNLIFKMGSANNKINSEIEDNLNTQKQTIINNQITNVNKNETQTIPVDSCSNFYNKNNIQIKNNETVLKNFAFKDTISIGSSSTTITLDDNNLTNKSFSENNLNKTYNNNYNQTNVNYNTDKFKLNNTINFNKEYHNYEIDEISEIKTNENSNKTLEKPQLSIIKQENGTSATALESGFKVKNVKKSLKTAAEDELRHEAQNFADSTTAHGIPLAIHAKQWYSRLLWTFLSICSVGLFTYQCILVFNKFQRKDKIVSVELQFENAAFPAVTICSLNPFKKHLARTVPEISETLDAYHQAVTYSKDAHQNFGPSRERRSAQNPGGFRYVQFEPVMSDCECDSYKFFAEKNNIQQRRDCIQKNSIPINNISVCICNYDRQDSTVWPCYLKDDWIESVCPDCNDIGYCNLPNTNGTNMLPCLCQKSVNYCLLRPERLKRMWEIRGNQIPDKNSPFRSDFLAQLKELGFENMTDEVAITTKTKEKLVLTMAALPVHRRIALSYGKSEFIRMCSFNGQQCDIINDFKLHVDPAFGNCYTFNANREKPLNSNRAGPSYGLRLLMHINTSDYLPTTQASGVRIAIHSPEEWPFPDSFGYSAPTDSVSSFGISLLFKRKVNRLPMPYGDCVLADEKPPDDYIYRNYKYEPEGCYKSCYQNQIILQCGCADPRYPVAFNDTKLCNSFDPLLRNCLLIEGNKFTRQHVCKCKHPCQHNVYTTTFSSAKFTTNAFSANDCTSKKCLFKAESAAMVEIYYEQMSYEVLSESESYMFVNFMSDVGGQAGLWLGASVITLFEFVVFTLRLLTIFCRRQKRQTDSTSNNFACDNSSIYNANLTLDKCKKLSTDYINEKHNISNSFNNLNLNSQHHSTNENINKSISNINLKDV